jgi:hypothetical protein
VIDFEAFYGDLRQSIALALPEVSPVQKGGGVYESDEIERKSFERLPGLPYAVIELSELESTDRLLAPEGHEAVAVVHYVCRQRDGERGQAQVRARLAQLASYLLTHDPAGYDLMDLAGYQIGTDHPANDVFITKGMPLVAGALRLAVVLSDRND